MNIGPRGVALIKRYEGCRLEAYDDGVGVWTIGWGHTGPEVKPGLRITQFEADTLLLSDLRWAEEAVRNRVTTRLRPSQFDALVSFTFNLGAGAFARSTLLKRVNEKQHARVVEQFGKWVIGGGKPMLGLARRRAAEAALYLEDNPHD